MRIMRKNPMREIMEKMVYEVNERGNEREHGEGNKEGKERL